MYNEANVQKIINDISQLVVFNQARITAYLFANPIIDHSDFQRFRREITEDSRRIQEEHEKIYPLEDREEAVRRWEKEAQKYLEDVA